jgi:hypothetical protein
MTRDHLAITLRASLSYQQVSARLLSLEEGGLVQLCSGFHLLSPRIRCWIVGLLAILPILDPIADELICLALRDANRTVRDDACIEVARRGKCSNPKLIGNIAACDPWWIARCSALDAIGACNFTSLTKKVEACLTSRNANVRSYAIGTLVMLGTGEKSLKKALSKRFGPSEKFAIWFALAVVTRQSLHIASAFNALLLVRDDNSLSLVGVANNVAFMLEQVGDDSYLEFSKETVRCARHLQRANPIMKPMIGRLLDQIQGKAKLRKATST